MWKVNDKISKLVPNPKALPTAWRWEEMKKLMLDSAQYVPEEQAERRALMLVNPGFGEVKGPSPYTTDTIYAGFQLVMPGETAPAHRHIAFAVRFIQESEKGFTSVAGQKIYLEHGDLVLTPSWQWHYHGNDGPTPTFWVDCLDIPLHVYARTNFLEPYPTAKVPDLVTDDSPFHFPWKTTQQALDAQDSPRAVYHYLSNGSPFSRTIAAQAERIKQGHTARLPRETCSFIYVVRKGSGYTKIDAPTGQKTIEWKEKDVFVVPSWSWVTHTADDAGDAYLFALTDRSLSDNLGLARVDYSAP
ncbi:RmlC-like cupin domain-containing protein [Exophiala viscosa]|uniref:RmlC-like cupin domain-containing protein n=1 Tax=Exophiala viscosa TaxID=2486360 RepID=UPI0021962A84|nr:RmlC-like cupin domain-containing protein [Exophiala viscosa]